MSAEKQTHLSGHKWHISELEFSPDGLHLASSSWDKTLRIWDLSTLESVFVLRHHRSPVTCLSWQPGVGTAGCLGVLASGSADSTVALWSGETGKLLQALSPHKGWVLGTSFSSDGTLLASAAWDKTVCLSDARTGQMLQKLTGHSTGVWTCAFQTSIGAGLLCSGADDGSLKIWDTRTASSVMSLVGGHEDSVKCCAWSPDGSYIASGATDSKISLWEPRSGTLLIKIRGHEDAVNKLQFYPVISSKSVPLIFSVGDNSCRAWHPLRKRGKQLQMIKQHRVGSEVEALSLSPDGTLLATGARDKDIILSSLDVSLTEVDALPIEDQNEAAINYGATLWKKYTRKVMQRILCEPGVGTDENDDFSQSSNNPNNTASLVGRAVNRTESKAKENSVEKAVIHVNEVDKDAQSDGVLREQRARLRKSSRPETLLTNGPVNNSTHEIDEVRQQLRHVKLDNPMQNGVTNGHQYADTNGQFSHFNSFDKGQTGIDENGESSPKRNGYHSHGDSSSAGSSSYYGDIEDVAKDMYDLANGGEDARL